MVSWIVVTSAVCALVGLCSCEGLGEYSSEDKFPESFNIQEAGSEEESGGLTGALGLQSFDGESHGHDHKVDLKHATSYQSFYLESKNPVPLVIKKEYEHKPIQHKYSFGSHENLVPQHESPVYEHSGYYH